jgi:hypothetical protein
MKFHPGLDRQRASSSSLLSETGREPGHFSEKSLGLARRTNRFLTIPAEFGWEGASYREAPLRPLDPQPPSLRPGRLQPVANCVAPERLVVWPVFRARGLLPIHDRSSPSSQTVRMTRSFRVTVLSVLPIRAAISSRL